MQHNPAAGHTLDLLTLLARHGSPQPAATLARELGLPRSSTYRLLATLVDRGYVAHLAESGRYGLGIAAYELGSAYQRQAPLGRIAAPALAKLVQAVQESAHLVILHGKDVMYVVEERAPGSTSLVTDVGVRLPAELTASGRAILAALPAKQVSALYPSPAALVQRGGQGFRTVAALRAELRETRSRGHAVERDTVTEGLASVAFPLLDHTGHPVAAVAVTYQEHRMQAARLLAVLEQLRRTAAALSARLGHPGVSV